MRDSVIRRAVATNRKHKDISSGMRSIDERRYVSSTMNRCAGFTLIELLLVIAIIGILIGLLVPAIQQQRHLVVSRAVEGDLRQLAAAAGAFHDLNGEFAGSMVDLARFCEEHPEICRLDVELASGRKNGYLFTISQPSSDGSTDEPCPPTPQLVAGPIHPGITGIDTFVADRHGNITRFLTPGAEQAQQQAFERIRAKAAETIAGLLRLDREAPPMAREFVRSPDALRSVFQKVDGNHDGVVSVDEVRNVDTGPELPINELLGFISEELKLDMLSPEARRAIGVEVSDLAGDPAAQFFTYDGLCSLTWWYIGDNGVVDSLCAQLKAAEAAEARGDLHAKARLLKAYTKEVAEQSCLTLTLGQAATLATLTRTL